MAIAGFIVQVMPDAAAAVEKYVAATAELTSYGLHEESSLIVVADSDSDRLESLMNEMQQLDGVLSIYLTSLNTEDELREEHPELCGHRS